MNKLEDKLQIETKLEQVGIHSISVFRLYAGVRPPSPNSAYIQHKLIPKIGKFAIQESGSLSMLKDRVEKYHDLSSSMSAILTKFEQRLGKLEQTILPVYNQTEQLQKRQKSRTANIRPIIINTPLMFTFVFQTFNRHCNVWNRCCRITMLHRRCAI